ncbi:SulP family inorganic anion transporter [Paremcibacter congregatus]|uniref:SulP family inorganic anion transporter n=1 Tax=Paremcibacter congregatus TaxID=2043170 RepID=UPI0030ECB841|tara:strand:+ start:4875 stop:6485 length:1611 start_codon:yes stop_codon:yes gene_type:complete
MTDQATSEPTKPTRGWVEEFGFNSFSRIKTESFSGLTVALALVPEAVAFAFVAQVNPLVGLYAAFIVGLVTALFGGRPGMISGATGALAVVMVSLVVSHGVEYLFATVVLMGIIQIIAGITHLGKFIRMVPHPVMLGFVNGLAIVIFLAQMGQFKTSSGEWLNGLPLFLMLGFVALTMGIIYVMPKITKAVPGPLAAIVIVTLIVIGFNLDIPRVGDLASIAGGLPTFHIPEIPLTLDSLWIILPYAIILAAIGLIESLLTLNLVSEITEQHGPGASKECAAQGAANLITGFFGGMGGCAMIGQSMINVKSGGRARLSGIVAALSLLAFILFASGLIEQIPLAALIGVMFMVVIGTFAWNSLKLIGKIPRHDIFVIVFVTGITVAYDLAIAVVAGVIISALVFAWETSKHIYATREIDAQGSKIYRLSGPLFFGSVASFMELFDPKQDPDDVIVDFLDSRVLDHSGLQAIDALAIRYDDAGKTLHLRHLSADCRRLLHKARKIVEVSVIEDPEYGVAVDYEGNYTLMRAQPEEGRS